MEAPWYEDGLCFSCTQCGNCCRNNGEYRYVYLMPPEVTALAEHLELTQAEFLERWCERDEGWTVLRMDLPQCPFLSAEGSCTVYSVRPRQCRTWPFWMENLESEASWKAAKTICPGMDTGIKVEWQEAQEIARRNEDWYEGRTSDVE
ncbi:MAG: YkgJ family cysteine cluster protein [Planctomycetota bacterium]|nr:YkgJ family cysteine cluster protein [Planctomycetota bacterium]